MFDPATVFTPQGLRQYHAHLTNLQNALFFLRNNADDLHLFDEELMSAIHTVEDACDGVLLTGDGETRDQD